MIPMFQKRDVSQKNSGEQVQDISTTTAVDILARVKI